MPTIDEKLSEERDIPVIYVDTFRIGYDAYKYSVELGITALQVQSPGIVIRVIMGPEMAKTFVETFSVVLNQPA